VNRKRPHLQSKKGIVRQMRHLSDKGQGINRQLPFVGNAGRGGHRAQGVNKKLPHIAASARGVQTRVTNEALLAYMHELASRLRQVRVCCGDWSRIVTNGALSYGATVGVFLDPPYSDVAGRTDKLYAVDDLNVAHDVRAWCIANGDNPRYRIVLAGYEDEHSAHMPASWRKVSYSANKAYGSSNSQNGLNDANRHKERLWYSPFCLTPQPTLFHLEST
jgi:hypothetical protein